MAYPFLTFLPALLELLRALFVLCSQSCIPLGVGVGRLQLGAGRRFCISESGSLLFSVVAQGRLSLRPLDGFCAQQEPFVVKIPPPNGARALIPVSDGRLFCLESRHQSVDVKKAAPASAPPRLTIRDRQAGFARVAPKLSVTTSSEIRLANSCVRVGLMLPPKSTTEFGRAGSRLAPGKLRNNREMLLAGTHLLRGPGPHFVRISHFVKKRRKFGRPGRQVRRRGEALLLQRRLITALPAPIA